MKNITIFPLSIILLLTQPSIGQQNSVLTSSTPLPGGGTGVGNVVAGPGNFYSNADAANFNVFVGFDSGKDITSGDNNVFTGNLSGRYNTTGGFNTFLGQKTGYSNTTGGLNSFIGSAAGYYNTTGHDNTFVGTDAGQSNTTASNNTFMGRSAGFSNTIGTENSFVGYQAGFGNIGGGYNAFMGYQAGYNSTGNYNSFLGNGAGYSNRGGGNTFIGYHTGYLNTTGYGNTFTGTESGGKNTSGYFNSFIGDQVGRSNTTGHHNTFITDGAGDRNTTGDHNTCLGHDAGKLNSSGSSNTCVGKDAGLVNFTGSDNSFFGHGSDAIGSNQNFLQRATALGYKAKVAVNDGLVLGDTVNVKVGIGTAYPNQRLTLRGNMNFIAYDNSLRLKNQPFLHFNEHESLALGLGAKIPADAERTLVLGSSQTEVQLPGVASNYLANSGQVLTVNESGRVLLTKPRIQVQSASEWADKVFEENYPLRPLSEVEDFIKKNKHLPGVPSAETMVAEGVDVVTIIAKQMEKIEELTLYVMELKKENAEIKDLREEVAELRKLVVSKN